LKQTVVGWVIVGIETELICHEMKMFKMRIILTETDSVTDTCSFSSAFLGYCDPAMVVESDDSTPSIRRFQNWQMFMRCFQMQNFNVMCS